MARSVHDHALALRLAACGAPPKMRQVAPRRAAPAPCHRAGRAWRQPTHHAAPWRSLSAGVRTDRTTARPGIAGLTCCTGGKSHQPKRATHRHQCKWQSLEEGNVLPGQALRGPSWRAASAGHASSSARRRSQIPAGGQGHRAAALLYLLLYQARELQAQDFEFICLTGWS